MNAVPVSSNSTRARVGVASRLSSPKKKRTEKEKANI